MKTEYSESTISFIEYKEPRYNEVATVLMDRPGGRQAVIAHIHVGYISGRKMCRVFDSDGKEVIPPSSSMEVIQEDIRKQEAVFHAQVAKKEQAVQQDFAEGERKRLKQLTMMRTRSHHSKSRTR